MKKLGVYLLLLSLVWVCVCGQIQAQTPPELSALALYLKAADPHASSNDVSAALKAQKELLASPDLAYSAKLKIASLTCMKARFGWFPVQQLFDVSDGVSQFEALRKVMIAAQDPNKRYAFYFYRGMTYFNFPDFLNKKQQAIEDLTQAEQLYPTLKRNPLELKQIRHALYGETL